MISNLLAIIHSIVLAIGVLLVIKFNNNPYKLTVRGKRFVFVCFLLVGYLMAQVLLHIEVSCDLRPNSNTPCIVRWM